MQPKRFRHERITRVNAKVARHINRSIILNTVRHRQPISRAEISALTKLNKSTVSSIVANLLAEDLLEESPERNSRLGRTPVNLRLRQGKHFVGAISFDAPCTRVAVVDLDGSIKARDELWTKAVPPENLIPQAVARLNALRSTLGSHKFRGIGVSVAGVVDSSQGQVVYAANLGWTDVDLAAAIREQMPDVEAVTVENDAKASALAELLLGKHHLTSRDLVFVSFGPGIGAGIVTDGRILGGNTHAAGEVGHMTVVDGGDPCPCGSRGCWELYASERAPVRWYAEAGGSRSGGTAPLTLPDVIGAARMNDERALKALGLWAQHIGVGISDMMAILDPEVVIVGGTITQIWDLVGGDISEAAHGRGTFARRRTTTILPSSLLDNPALVGAAALSIKRIFVDFSSSLSDRVDALSLSA